MKQTNVVSKMSKIWKIAFIAFALGVMTIIPFYFGEQTEAQTTTPTFLTANLTGAPIGTATPRGSGRYYSDSASHRVIDVEVSNVNLAYRTVLEVSVNGTALGTFQLGSTRAGRLHLETPMQSVPAIAAGATIEVKNGAAVVVSGTFVLPPPPTPSPTRSPSPSPSATRTPYPSPSPFPTLVTAFFAPLEGAVIDGVMPRGVGQYAEFSTGRNLSVFVNHVNLPDATGLTVSVNGTAAGQIVLDDDGDGRLRLVSTNGDTVPTITAGSTLVVKNGETTILSGTFRAYMPSPSPSPSVTPTGTPTPHPSPSPRPNRVFGGRLNGMQVVPSVTTEARGVVKVVLNEAETQIRVFAGFLNLSSAQTTATINGPAMAGENAETIFTIPAVGGTSGRFPIASFDVTAAQVAQLRNGVWYLQIGSTNNPTGEIRGQIRSHSRHSAFSGSEVEELAVFRPNSATWYVSTAAGLAARTLGSADSIPVSGDFDGDGKTDYASFRSGTWSISRSSDGGLTTKQFGMANDLPVRGDYDGDGNNDLAVFRPSNGTWYVQKSNGSGLIIIQFGTYGDRPVATDFDGDGRTDITVFRQSTGTWYWLKSSNGAFGAVQFGQNLDVPVAGDFDGDGADDVTVFRPSTGAWYSLKSSNGAFQGFGWGTDGDIPVAGNYDDDVTTDFAVYRPSNGTWYIFRSSDGAYDFRTFGTTGDIPTMMH